MLSRMGGKLPRRIEKRKLTQEEALAIQLEFEDEQLQDWRKVMQELRTKFENKKRKESGEKVKSAAEKKVEPPRKPKAIVKEKSKAKNVKKN